MTKITIDKALLEQAIDALETYGKQYPHMQKGYLLDAEQSLRAALAAPAVEPAAWVLSHSQGIDAAAKRVLAQRDELLEALTEIKNRIEDHPMYAPLTMEEECEVGGDTAELSYLVRVADEALKETA